MVFVTTGTGRQAPAAPVSLAGLMSIMGATDREGMDGASRGVRMNYETHV